MGGITSSGVQPRRASVMTCEFCMFSAEEWVQSEVLDSAGCPECFLIDCARTGGPLALSM